MGGPAIRKQENRRMQPNRPRHPRDIPVRDESKIQDISELLDQNDYYKNLLQNAGYLDRFIQRVYSSDRLYVKVNSNWFQRQINRINHNTPRDQLERLWAVFFNNRSLDEKQWPECILLPKVNINKIINNMNNNINNDNSNIESDKDTSDIDMSTFMYQTPADVANRNNPSNTQARPHAPNSANSQSHRNTKTKTREFSQASSHTEHNTNANKITENNPTGRTVINLDNNESSTANISDNSNNNNKSPALSPTDTTRLSNHSEDDDDIDLTEADRNKANTIADTSSHTAQHTTGSESTLPFDETIQDTNGNTQDTGDITDAGDGINNQDNTQDTEMTDNNVNKPSNEDNKDNSDTNMGDGDNNNTSNNDGSGDQDDESLEKYYTNEYKSSNKVYKLNYYIDGEQDELPQIPDGLVLNELAYQEQPELYDIVCFEHIHNLPLIFWQLFNRDINYFNKLYKNYDYFDLLNFWFGKDVLILPLTCNEDGDYPHDVVPSISKPELQVQMWHDIFGLTLAQFETLVLQRIKARFETAKYHLTTDQSDDINENKNWGRYRMYHHTLQSHVRGCFEWLANDVYWRDKAVIGDKNNNDIPNNILLRIKAFDSKIYLHSYDIVQYNIVNHQFFIDFFHQRFLNIGLDSKLEWADQYCKLHYINYMKKPRKRRRTNANHNNMRFEDNYKGDSGDDNSNDGKPGDDNDTGPQDSNQAQPPPDQSQPPPDRDKPPSDTSRHPNASNMQAQDAIFVIKNLAEYLALLCKISTSIQKLLTLA